MSEMRREWKSWDSLTMTHKKMGIFGIISPFCYFPLWYPTIIFALSGVGVLGFRRQFSIRSALVATTIVAALIGMAVIL